MTDGIFFEVGPGSRPVANRQPVGIAAITDGTAFTLLLGERSHYDPNFDSFAAVGWQQTMGEYGYWTGSGGNLSLGDVTLSGYVPINYRLPFSYSGRARPVHRRTRAPPFNTMPICGCAPLAVSIAAGPTSPWLTDPCIF